jgi:uncharacterized membrane protein
VPLHILFAAVDLIIIGLAIPMLRRMVPPNNYYGFRVPATFADKWVWYEANARAGRDMVAFGIIHLATTLLLRLFMNEALYGLVNSALLIVGLIALTTIGWKRANHLLAERQSQTPSMNRGRPTSL